VAAVVAAGLAVGGAVGLAAAAAGEADVALAAVADGTAVGATAAVWPREASGVCDSSMAPYATSPGKGNRTATGTDVKIVAIRDSQ